ncbi:hypothetical protein [Methanobrevibacter sp.]|uniref:DUF7226 domain-containing protein n=1 Tax=Methanobrevibacter sp. TaxID=66852 RepID=UPI00386F5FFE
MTSEEYIILSEEKYIVTRTFDNGKYIFGRFDTLEEAIKKRDELDYDGWPLYDEFLVDKEINEPHVIKINGEYYEVYDPSKIKIANNPNYKRDVMNLVENIEFIEDSSNIPFPQSDDLNRFIFIGQNLLKKDMSKEDIKQSNQIGNRIVNMYTSTGFYFHVFEKYKKDNKVYYKLSDKGRHIFELNEYDRNLNICKCILEHEILYRIFMDSLSNSSISKNNIVNIMLEYDLNLKSMVTIERRAGCISSWMHWIFNLMDFDKSNQSTLC